MVEREQKLDAVFQSLSDPTRRDILRIISKKNMSVGQIAIHYRLSFAGVAKHLEVLHQAQLITKQRRGKEQIVSLSPQTLVTASKYLGSFQQLWENRLNSLDKFLQTINKPRRRQRFGGKKGKK